MIVLRHCQSEFNLHFSLTRRDPGLVDPGLTAEGLAQAEAAATALCGHRITRIVSSPYRRALQTAAPLAARLGVGITVTSLVRERYAFACDIGSPRLLLQRDWPGIDFSALDGDWWHDVTAGPEGGPPEEGPPEKGPVVESENSVIERAGRFRAAMAGAPDHEDTVVVSHWGFLLALTGRSLENGGWLRVDPAAPPPESIVWRHGAAAAT